MLSFAGDRGVRVLDSATFVSDLASESENGNGGGVVPTLHWEPASAEDPPIGHAWSDGQVLAVLHRRRCRVYK